jgi:8-oxo-dGTP diphosphatase
LQYSRIAHALLGETFTMAELRGVHEAVLRTRLDPANFRRTMEASGTLVDTGQRLAGTPHRPPALYRFDTALGRGGDPIHHITRTRNAS